MIKALLTIIAALTLTSCTQEEKLFTLLNPSKTSIDFTNGLTNSTDLNILNYLYYYNGAGVAAGDFNNDGWTDLYFTGNQVADKLYLNQKNLSFININKAAGIDNDSGWTTGVTTVDINNDGKLDLYICKVGALSPNSHNLLYVNQGNNENGVPVFKEESKKYGLNISTYATQSAFLDYDLDGDLDMYLLNHSVHPNSNYGHGKKRNLIDSLAGDRFHENENGYFKDVSKEVGVHQGSIGYGLGIAISDINNDGYPDIYIGNDFFENDYLYINQKNGTFLDINETDETILGHTTHYSMGNDIADINNDGNFDILSVDMLPENLKSYKTSGTEYNYQTYSSYLKNGYHPQFMQNTLHFNAGNNMFLESAYTSGIASTEWSWAPLIADYDNDGNKDIYITNGILGATNDMDFINFIANENIQKRLGKGMKEKDMTFINEIPKKHVPNYFFKNQGDETFKDATNTWFEEIPSYSNGAVYTDLDNDGDLELVVNNVNERAFILKNNTRELEQPSNYIQISFKGSEANRFGIGAKVKVYLDSLILSTENNVSRGFMSSISPELHFGLGKREHINYIEITWPDGKIEEIKSPAINQKLVVDYANAITYAPKKNLEETWFLKNIDSLFSFKHKDFTSVEFNRDPLIPFANTNQGPAVTVGDINKDGLEDVFIGGGKMQASALFIQTKTGTFKNVQKELFKKDAKSEDVDNLFFDADKDGDLDLIVVSGGNEFKTGNPLKPRLYINENGSFKKDTLQFQNVFINASSVTAIDIDNDNDLDLCITSNSASRSFGKTAPQFIFENNGSGTFSNITAQYAPTFQKIGNVEAIKWIDLNNDTFLDAIVVGKWMPISIFLNDGNQLRLYKGNLNATSGWWNCVEAGDFDKDGDIDIIAGNWGLNTRLNASEEKPITLYQNDFDDNGNIEPIVTYYYRGEETTLSSKDELVKQLPMLNKKFLSYEDFANASFEELLPAEKIKNAETKKVYELASVYFENQGNNTFKKHLLPINAQKTDIFNMKVDDFNGDSYDDVLLVGNNHEISTQLGRLDASHGILLLNDRKGFFKTLSNQYFNIPGAARDTDKISINDTVYYITTINNNYPVFLEKKK
ncbi:VCBS repeat-containing protein [Galbibacter sp. BG1]|uniref:VCBS repeat-containing protein n=1 Tax=Galbibacter sp. BG1 TaxID=1170699 RepID=UPI0015C0EB78|nr:VCBS repeat-containing protein [Galbibacter sp. BG1]QLE00831.1 VCBS repeat-containing protein [Galbibacter sp. BG1]